MWFGDDSPKYSWGMRNAGNASDLDKSERVKWFKKKKKSVYFNFTWNKCLKLAFEGKKESS